MADHHIFDHSGAFSGYGDLRRNGSKYDLSSHNLVYVSTNNNHLPNPTTNEKRVEISLFVKVLLWVGLGSYIGGIMLNWGSWKADLMFMAGFFFMLSRGVFFCIKQWQEKKMRKVDRELKELDLREKKRSLDWGEPL